MPRGRPRKPTALKALAGFPGRRYPTGDEPKLESGAPRFPNWMDDEAKRIWRRMCRMLKDLHIVSPLDEAALASYCVLYSRWRQAEVMMQRYGVISKGRDGQPVLSPLVKLSNDCAAQLLRLSVEFGLTPASRDRIHAIPSVGQTDDSVDAAEAAAMHRRLLGSEN